MYRMHGKMQGGGKMTDEEKKAFGRWLSLNGGEEGSLYQTFPEEELEYIFLTAYRMGLHVDWERFVYE